MEDRYVFFVEWFDQVASIVKKLRLTFYPNNCSVELFNLKTKKLFLKRTPMQDIDKSHLYLGAILNIFSRQFKIVDYADIFTRNAFEIDSQKTFAMIKPDAFDKFGQIIKKIEEQGIQITKLKMRQLQLTDTQQFYKEHQGKPFYDNLTQFIASGPVIGMELVGKDMIKKWRLLIGPTNCQQARSSSPNSIRALYGQEGVRNAVHGSDSIESADRELDFFFNQVQNTNSFLNNKISCAVIKPHIIRERKLGTILQQLNEKLKNQNMNIVAAQMFQLERSIAKEFLEVYKDVVSEYSQLAQELSDGNCLVLAIKGQNLPVQSLRNICGPHDPQIAKSLRQQTLRALFGKNKVQNGIHCTDLEEDGLLECEFFFSILQN